MKTHSSLYEPLFHFEENFEKERLLSLAKWMNGAAFKLSDYTKQGLPIIKIAEIKNGITSQTKFSNLSEKENYLIKKNDFLFSWSGQPETSIDIFLCAFDKGLLNQHIYKIDPQEMKIRKDYFFYLMKYLKKTFIKIAQNKQTTGLGHVTKKDLEKIIVKFPSNKDKQDSISNILKSIDEKIALNNKNNETLEEIAKALFKSFFIDFDPVRAKAEGSSTGLPNEISNLFPDSFEDSEIGKIPNKWEIKSLDEIATFLNGLALQKYPSKGDSSDLPVIKIAQLRRGNSNDSDKCSSDIPEKYIIRDADILFSWSGSLLVDIWTGGVGALNQHLFKVTSDIHKKWFILNWTKYHLQEFQRIAKSKATTMGHIQRKHLSEAKIILPPKYLMKEINAIFDPLLEREINARLESKILIQLRDNLLPKLISGELRIPDAEKMIEEIGI